MKVALISSSLGIMAPSSLCYLLTALVIISLFPSSSPLSQSLPSDHNPGFPTTIAASPSILPGPQLSPPFQPLSPDVAPLLPVPTAGSSVPVTIPSSPSPPNPDTLSATGPASALAPFGSLPVSGARTRSSVECLRLQLAALITFVCCSIVINWDHLLARM